MQAHPAQGPVQKQPFEKHPDFMWETPFLILKHWSEGKGLAGIVSWDRSWWAPYSWAFSALLKPAETTFFFSFSSFSFCFPLFPVFSLCHLYTPFLPCLCPLSATPHISWRGASTHGRCPGFCIWWPGFCSGPPEDASSSPDSGSQKDLSSWVPWESKTWRQLLSRLHRQ